jgi:hypothetical protein
VNYKGLPNSFRLPARWYTDKWWAQQFVASRPRSRVQCADVERPCPYVGCRYNLWIVDITRRGTIRHMDCDPWEMPPDMSCVLDVADRGELQSADVEAFFGVSKEWVRQLTNSAIRTITPELEGLL